MTAPAVSMTSWVGAAGGQPITAAARSVLAGSRAVAGASVTVDAATSSAVVALSRLRRAFFDTDMGLLGAVYGRLGQAGGGETSRSRSELCSLPGTAGRSRRSSVRLARSPLRTGCGVWR